MLIRELGSTPGMAVGLVGSLFVCIWREVAVLRDLELMERVEAETVPKLGTFSMLSWVSVRTARMGGPGVRDKAAELHRRYESQLIASAAVLPEAGLIGTLSRSFMTAHQILVRPKTPIHVCRTIEEACRHIQRTPGQSRLIASVSGLASEVAQFQAARVAPADVSA